MIHDSDTAESISDEHLFLLVMERHYASDEQREQAIEKAGLREQKWLPTRDLPRERVQNAKRAAYHDLSLSIYAKWSKDFQGHDDERETYVRILSQWEVGGDVSVKSFKGTHLDWLAAPQPYTQAAFIHVRDGLIIPQDYPRRDFGKPPANESPATPKKDDEPKDEPKQPKRASVPVVVQQEIYREIVAESPEWDTKQINAEANRRLEKAGYDEDTYALPGLSSTQRNMAKDPLIVETREAGRFVWHRAWCTVAPERAVIDGDEQTRVCLICGADITHKRSDCRTCSPACRVKSHRKM